MHTKACSQVHDGPLPTQLSLDGVSEARSNTISLDVYSIRIIGCKQVYPIRIVRPLSKVHANDQHHLNLVVQDLNNSDFDIVHFVGDNPVRARAKMVLNHASLFPCEYCFGIGTRIKINTSRMRQITKIVWPASSRHGEPKTSEAVLNIVNEIEENPNMDRLSKKGVVGRSCLFSIPNFDFVRDSPAEYMHNVCLGVVKRMVELTFNVGEKRSRVTKRKLSSTAEFNQCMAETKVTRETSRRARKLDLAVMKAQEMRNLLLLFFPHVLQCIESNAKERKLWLLLVFMIRSCTLPTEEFLPYHIEILADVCAAFYELYEKLFGQVNCTYNTHVVSSHLMDMRAHGPLTFTSAFGFEAFYGEMRHAFAPGTQSTLKQIFQKIMLKRSLSHHQCENTLFFSEKDSPLECNSLVYSFKHNEHKMFKILSVQENHLLCYPQGRYECSFREVDDLNFASIGVYKKGGVSEEPVIVPKSDISGKVFLVGDYLITCPTNVLNEK